MEHAVQDSQMLDYYETEYIPERSVVIEGLERDLRSSLQQAQSLEQILEDTQQQLRLRTRVLGGALLLSSVVAAAGIWLW